MAQKTKKFYAIKIGKKTGVFDNWNDTKLQVEGHPNAKYKSFNNPKDAWDFVHGTEEVMKNVPNPLNLINELSAVAYTDGSFNETNSTYSYGAVVLWKNRTFQMSKRFANERDVPLRNVAGELEGAKKAMKFAQLNKIEFLTLYHDYEGVAAWALGHWKANLPLTQEYKIFIEDIKKTVHLEFIWVKGHSGDYYNDMVDKLASTATFEELRKEI